MEAHRLAEAQREAALGERDLGAGFGAAWQYADRARGLAALLQHQEVAACRAAADARAQAGAPGAHEGEGHRAAGHGEIGGVVVQHARRRATPVREQLFQAGGDRVGAEHAAVEQQGVGDGVRGGGAVGGGSVCTGAGARACVAVAVCLRRQAERRTRDLGVAAQEGGEVAADRRVGGIGQTELDDRGAPAPGRLVRRDQGQEAVHHEAQDLVAAQLGRARRADQARPGAEQGDLDLFRRVRGEQLLLRHAAALHQLRELGGGQAFAAREQALLHQVGERQVHVVAAQHQVVADADAGQARRRDAVRGGLDLDQGEVGGAAADVAHQQQAGLRERGGELFAVAEQPVVEGGLRLLQQAQARQAGEAGGLQGERACALVEGGGHREHDVLVFERGFGVPPAPRRAHVGEVARARHHRRNLGHVLGRAPGQDGGAAIDAGVRQPALGAGHRAPGHLGAELASILPDHRRADHRGLVRLIEPGEICGQAQRGGVELARGGVVAHRGQQRARGELAAADELLDLQYLDAVLAGSGEGDHGVAGAEVDADGVARRHARGLRPRRCRARRTAPSSARCRPPAGPRARACRPR
ncbi:hypothetical protein MASR2M50_36930 [Thauera sp.]